MPIENIVTYKTKFGRKRKKKKKTAYKKLK